MAVCKHKTHVIFFYAMSFKLFVHDKEELDELVERLLALKGIESVTRFETEAAA